MPTLHQPLHKAFSGRHKGVMVPTLQNTPQLIPTQCLNTWTSNTSLYVLWLKGSYDYNQAMWRRGGSFSIHWLLLLVCNLILTIFHICLKASPWRDWQGWGQVAEIPETAVCSWKEASTVAEQFWKCGGKPVFSLPFSSIHVSTEFQVRRESAKVWGQTPMAALHRARLPATDENSIFWQETCLLGVLKGSMPGMPHEYPETEAWLIGCHPNTEKSGEQD